MAVAEALLTLPAQLMVFMRTDLYFVLQDLSGCANLYADGSAYLRRRGRLLLRRCGARPGRSTVSGRSTGPAAHYPTAQRRAIRVYSAVLLAGTAVCLGIEFARIAARADPPHRPGRVRDRHVAAPGARRVRGPGDPADLASPLGEPLVAASPASGPGVRPESSRAGKEVTHMLDISRTLADKAEDAAVDEKAQPIIIRKLDRLETTDYNSQGAS